MGDIGRGFVQAVRLILSWTPERTRPWGRPSASP